VHGRLSAPAGAADLLPASRLAGMDGGHNPWFNSTQRANAGRLPAQPLRTPPGWRGLGARGTIKGGEALVAYQLSIRQEPHYLHAVVTGANDADTVARYLDELRRECIARGCYRVLIEERLEGPRLGTFPVYKVASEGSERARGLLHAIAFVDVNAAGNLMQFAETVAVNRGLPIAVFATVEEARQWLERRAQASAAAPGQEPVA